MTTLDKVLSTGKRIEHINMTPRYIGAMMELEKPSFSKYSAPAKNAPAVRIAGYPVKIHQGFNFSIKAEDGTIFVIVI